MKKLGVYFYPNAAPPLHDTLEWYHNTVPFCVEGIQQWCSVTSPDRAEFLHMGTVREFDPNPFNTWPFWSFRDEPSRHIVDLEGDYAEGTFRKEFNGAVRIACGAPDRWRESGNVFPRPTMSRMLLELYRGKAPALSPPKEACFGFVGKSDSAGVRGRLVEASVACSIPAHVALTDTWNGPSPPEAPCRDIFIRNAQTCSVMLCPQGEHAVNTARFYEACCYGRFPVVIGRTMVPGEDMFDTSFVYQMDSGLAVDGLHEELQKLAGIPFSEMLERGKAARDYWEKVIRAYFDDPTLFFIQWLKRQGLRDGGPEEAQ